MRSMRTIMRVFEVDEAIVVRKQRSLYREQRERERVRELGFGVCEREKVVKGFIYIERERER